MKKLLPILLATSLLLSACSISGNNKEDLFQKKLECAKYSGEVLTFGKELSGAFIDRIEEIFYSPSKNSCFFVALGTRPDGTRHGRFLFDFLSRKYLDGEFFKDCKSGNADEQLECLKISMQEESEMRNTIKELKGE